MEFKEPKKRVTKNDKKNKKQPFSQKHIRNVLKQKEQAVSKRNDGALPPPKCTLFPNGRIRV
jgi:hypothetical protein|tara:strand:- start:362 stop:547 length:186 start_codon:yes stop_codon:yes gene_type:complete